MGVIARACCSGRCSGVLDLGVMVDVLLTLPTGLSVCAAIGSAEGGRAPSAPQERKQRPAAGAGAVAASNSAAGHGPSAPPGWAWTPEGGAGAANPRPRSGETWRLHRPLDGDAVTMSVATDIPRSPSPEPASTPPSAAGGAGRDGASSAPTATGSVNGDPGAAAEVRAQFVAMKRQIPGGL